MLYRPVMLGVLAVAACAHGALACGYHPGLTSATLETVHPKSLGVAVAIHQAVDRGLLQARPEKASLPTFAGVEYRKAVQELRALQHKLADATAFHHVGDQSQFWFVFVRSRLWAKYTVGPNDVGVEIHSPAASDGETVVLSDERVLNSVLDEKLELGTALDLGLIHFANDEDGRALNLFRAALGRDQPVYDQ